MPITAGIRAFAAACSLALAYTPAASADVKGFNAAMKKGDIQTAAIEAASTWTTWDKADPDTALLAREFGFVSLLAGKNAEAEMFGKFLVEEGATLKTPDDQPQTSAVLYRAGQFRQKPNSDNREALMAALTTRASSPGIDMTSVVAWEALFGAAWSAGNWDNAIQDATQAAEFMKRDEKGVLARRRSAELFVAAARFLRDRNKATTIRYGSYNALADVHDAIARDIDAVSPGAAKQLWPLKWRANAWVNSAESYIRSGYEQTGSLINTNVKSRDLVDPRTSQLPPDESGLPLCDGKFEGKSLQYPGSKEYKGLVGSVIARLETDVTGKVIKTEVLAAVPSDAFAASVVATTNTWRLVPAKGVDRSTCRLNTRDRTFSVTFTIG